MKLDNLVKKTEKLKLLYVEDDDELRASTIEIFEDFFEEILIAGNGIDGLDIFRNNKIDIVITDLNMPKMDGLEMIQNIRELDKDVDIFVFSAYNESGIVEQAKSYNIKGYFYKPMDFTYFIKELDKAI